IASLEERLRRAQQAVEREKAQVAQQGVQAAISVGATLLGAFLGRKVTSVGPIGRATTAARGAARVLKEREDVGRATETSEVLQQQLADLEAEFNAEMAELEGKGDPLTERLEGVAIRPKKTHIAIQLCALAWAPHWQVAQGQAIPAWE
ncbi:MAG TPA: ATP-binding protein, partial [Candidatus Methylomirabilis sp.]|nr:ATP-binding protein [Candidatus Methylomirabilis sp.]